MFVLSSFILVKRQDNLHASLLTNDKYDTSTRENLDVKRGEVHYNVAWKFYTLRTQMAEFMPKKLNINYLKILLLLLFKRTCNHPGLLCQSNDNHVLGWASMNLRMFVSLVAQLGGCSACIL